MPPRKPDNNPQRKERRCLKCQQMFDSAGPGNRICFGCNWENSQLAARAVAVPIAVADDRTSYLRDDNV